MIQIQEGEDLSSTSAAFFVLSYIKKLCMHPQLLGATSMDKKRNLGLLSPEEEEVLQAQIEAQNQQRQDWNVRTRKSNKVVNTKQVKQLKALEAKTSPTGLE